MTRAQARPKPTPPEVSRNEVGVTPSVPPRHRRSGGIGPGMVAPSLHLTEQELLRATVTSSPTALTVLGRDGRILIWNPAAERLFGFPASEVVGGPMPTLDEGSRDQFNTLLQDALGGHDVFGLELRRRHRDGHLVDVALSTVALHDAGGRVVAALGAYQDISDRKAAEVELVRQAQTDELTGLANRNGLEQRLRQCHASERHQLAVINIDLDHFKQVNDALGHPVGDRILRAYAERLGNSVRPGDVVARLEGAAFAVLMSGIDPEAVESVVERLLRGLAQTYVVDGHEVELKATGGVALQYRVESPAEVVRRAGVALHYAKQVSRGGFQVLDEALDRAFQDRVELSVGLRGAAQRGELRLHYQPIVAADTGRIVGVEALVRWQHPERGLLAPDRFIGIAEETGSISAVGRWVLHQACATLRQWSEAGPRAQSLAMSVNLSVAQLQDRELVEDVAAALAHSGLRPQRLHLEVTESVLITDPASAARALGELRELGVTLAIDDFGTGNASLTALQRFPFQVLKIDRSFVSGIGIRSEDTTIVAATLALAHGLGLRVVAEGVETAEQADFLVGDGCEELQGFLFGRPEPARVIHPLLSGRRLYHFTSGRHRALAAHPGQLALTDGQGQLARSG
ncbi:MAG: putative bifunctional diguanylate cyclase/phosphodiesterase [Candidatus Dormibacteria bacterium]